MYNLKNSCKDIQELLFDILRVSRENRFCVLTSADVVCAGSQLDVPLAFVMLTAIQPLTSNTCQTHTGTHMRKTNSASLQHKPLIQTHTSTCVSLNTGSRKVDNTPKRTI